MRKFLWFHRDATFSPESLSRTLDQSIVSQQSEGPSLQNENPPQGMLFLRWLQLTDKVPLIHGFSYIVRSSPCSKHYNALTSMRDVINSGGYLCMTILTIKWRD